MSQEIRDDKSNNFTHARSSIEGGAEQNRHSMICLHLRILKSRNGIRVEGIVCAVIELNTHISSVGVLDHVAFLTHEFAPRCLALCNSRHDDGDSHRTSFLIAQCVEELVNASFLPLPQDAAIHHHIWKLVTGNLNQSTSSRCTKFNCISLDRPQPE